MTTEEFNALPLEARLYIQSEIGCLTCGKTKDLGELYQQFKNMKVETLFTLRMGAVSYTDAKTKEQAILYPIVAKDSSAEIKAKLRAVLRVAAVKPDAFNFVNTSEIEKILKSKKVIALNDLEAEAESEDESEENGEGIHSEL